ncbi:MAG: cardiolipin synthase [Blautia sp.]
MGQEREAQEDKILTLEKGKRGLLRIVFGRTFIVLLLLAAQVVLMVLGFGMLKKYIPYLFGSYVGLSLLIVYILINRPGNPAIQISWVILILVVPVVGALLYLFVETQLGHRLIHKRLQYLIRQTTPYMPENEDVMERLRAEDPGTANLASYMKDNGGFPVYENTRVKYYPLGDVMFDDLIDQLEKAENFIFLEFFIVKEGYMWGRVLKILEEKVKQGVEVRMMYDGMCSIALLPYNYPKKLQKLGIQCKMYAPIHPTMSTHYNNRDHRKILVIDGHTAFTGGINLADEYINRVQVYGHWKDTAVMVQGEAVQSFTLMFLQMWNITEKADTYEKYLSVHPSNCPESQGFVLPYGDSPMDKENVGEMVYMDIINRAERYVHIMTPYLILDHEMVTALTFAAKRGVEVVVILPHIPDKKYAFALAKNHYPELLRAGVKIYEYTPGFVHAKVFVSDDVRAVVGTINLDYRSLYLHFECAAFLYQVPEIASIEKDVQETLEKCQQMTLETCKKEKLGMKIAGKLLRPFAPLM